MPTPMLSKVQEIYFHDHLPGCPARISIGRAGATVYDKDGAVMATLPAATMDRIAQAWGARTPPTPYHFLGREAEKCV